MPRIKKTIKKKLSVKSVLSIPKYGVTGEQKGDIPLSKDVFSIDGKPELLAHYVRVYLANQRQGTASTKTRSDVRGSTRKIYRQKGTGRARHGDIKAPIFVGGGIVGGPKPRDFSLRINKKQAKKALLYALTLKSKEHAIVGLDDTFKKIEPKTKIFARFLKSLGFTNEKVLLILPKLEKNNLALAARNLSNVEITTDKAINPYLILKSSKMLVFEDTLKSLSPEDKV